MFHEMCEFNFQQALRNPQKFGVPIFYFVWFLCLQKKLPKKFKESIYAKTKAIFQMLLDLCKENEGNHCSRKFERSVLIHTLFKRFFRDQPGLITCQNLACQRKTKGFMTRRTGILSKKPVSRTFSLVHCPFWLLSRVN